MKYTYEIKDVSGRIVQTIKSESSLKMEEKKDKSVNLYSFRNDNLPHNLPHNLPLQVRISGIYKDKGFWLNSCYNWEIKQDEEKCLVLVPTLK